VGQTLTMGKIIKFRKRRKAKLPEQWQEYRPKSKTQSGWVFAGTGLLLGAIIGIGIVAAPSMESTPLANAIEFPSASTGAGINAGSPNVEVPTTEDRSASATQADQYAQADNVAPAPPPRSFALCHAGGGTNCVVDGDTVWMDGIKIRVADIDAPETHPPRCEQEADLGNRATLRLQELLNAGPVETASIGNRDEDKYGRKLRVLVRSGQSLGNILVSEGLARTWDGGRHPWC